MFDKKTIDAYKSISAPESLRRKVLNLEENDKRSFGFHDILKLHYPRAYALGGSLLILMLVIFSVNIYNGMSLKVTEGFDGIAPAAFDRQERSRAFIASEEIIIPLELKSFRKANIRVSAGHLKLTDQEAQGEGEEYTSLDLSKGQAFQWVLEDEWEAKEAVISITRKNKKIEYSLYYDEEKNLWGIREE